METDERLELVQEAQGKLWEALLQDHSQEGRLYEWVSSFHPENCRCYLADSQLYYGSYNVGCKVKFDDGTVWLIRFPQAGKTHSNYADEKVADEVAAINLIRSNTTIPVPEVKAWGSATQNPLGLGPFIIMSFIEDVIGLNKLLREPGHERRFLREDVTDEEIETIFTQFAGIMLQLWKLDFRQIGGLKLEGSPNRPLTWKAHEILQSGGVDTFRTSSIYHRVESLTRIIVGNQDAGFSSATAYFQSVVRQDWDQLVRQANSAYDRDDALLKFRSLKVLETLVPRFIHKDYDRTKFKFFCDDLGLANLMVRSRQDLTIVGVVDLEWSYSGPAQLAGSAPWWLLMDRPTNADWDCYCSEPVAITSRYTRFLKKFQDVLKEEEARTQGYEHHELSNLIQWSRDSGAMWLHMLLMTGFNDPSSFPFTRLIEHVGKDEWAKLEHELDEEEVETFANKKMLELEQYKLEVEDMKVQNALIDGDRMRTELFVARYEQSLACAGPLSKILTGSEKQRYTTIAV